MKTELETLGIIALCFLIGGAIFEVVLLGTAFIYADTIECNLLWCEFKTTREITSESHIIRSVTTSSSQECYLNGKQINCSEMPVW